jgi:hypothetical protein
LVDLNAGRLMNRENKQAAKATVVKTSKGFACGGIPAPFHSAGSIQKTTSKNKMTADGAATMLDPNREDSAGRLVKGRSKNNNSQPPGTAKRSQLRITVPAAFF